MAAEIGNGRINIALLKNIHQMTNKEWALKMIPVLIHWARYSWETPHYYSDLTNAVGHKTNQIGKVLELVQKIIDELKEKKQQLSDQLQNQLDTQLQKDESKFKMNLSGKNILKGGNNSSKSGNMNIIFKPNSDKISLNSASGTLLVSDFGTFSFVP